MAFTCGSSSMSLETVDGADRYTVLFHQRNPVCRALGHEGLLKNGGQFLLVGGAIQLGRKA